MVYCGKPSKGCQTCRTRKIKCDQSPNGCSQCSKAGRDCPGYRVQLDLMFRNESSTVAAKSQAKEALKKKRLHHVAQQDVPTCKPQSKPLKPEDEDSESIGPEQAQQRQWVLHRQSPSTIAKLPPGISMKPFLVDYATTFFIQNFVIGLGPSPGPGISVSVGHKISTFVPYLAAGMRAVGLAGFANIITAPEVMAEARLHYMKALRLTNVALRSPTDATKDSTLLSIMILGLYETVTGNSQKSLSAWATHVNGAAALIKMRGPEQLSTPSGLRMFIQVTSSLLISCVQRELPMPQHIVELRKEASKIVDSNDPAWRVQGTVIEFVDFRAKMRDKTIRNPHDVIENALALDGAFLSIFDTAPLAWRYQTVPADKDPDIVWGGYYHVYYDYWVAQIWNAARTCRILLNEVIREQLLAGFAARPPYFLEPIHIAQYQVSTDTLFQLRDDILASIPQHLGYSPALRFAQARFSTPSSPSRDAPDSSVSTSDWSARHGVRPREDSANTDCSQSSSDVFEESSVTYTESQQQHQSQGHLCFEEAMGCPEDFAPMPSLPTHIDYTPSPASSKMRGPPVAPTSTVASPNSSEAFFTAPKDEVTNAELPMLRGSGGYFLLWPLYLVGAMDIATDDIRKWVCQCLRGIGRTMGIYQAITLAGFLERNDDMAAWKRANMDARTTSVPSKTTQKTYKCKAMRQPIIHEWEEEIGGDIGNVTP